MSSSPYQPAATLLNQLWEQSDQPNKKRKSLKSLVFDDKTGQLKCSKTTYAQVCHVQKHLPTLQAVWQKHANKNQGVTVQNEGLLYVLLYELLLGPNQSIRGGGKLKRQLTQQESALRHYLRQIQASSPGEEMITSTFDNDTWPRYIRVNTCQNTTQQVVDVLRSIKSDSKFTLYLDAHVPDLLVVPPSATALILSHTVGDSDADKNKKVTGQWNPQTSIVLQDKSSCFPALCLISLLSADQQIRSQPWELMDACAAPGNKTTHLAALASHSMAKSGTQQKTCTIHAFDRDKQRHALLQRRCDALVNGDDRVIIQTKQEDFLTVDPEEYPNVRGILLDPTCSGSGMRDNFQGLKHSTEKENDGEERLEKLSYFQYKALLHACSFPQVEYIVYSTCSVNAEENENVVHRVLAESPSSWHVVPPPALAHWKRRGQASSKDTVEKHMIRVDPLEDETNGFFVCCLARSSSHLASKQDASLPRKAIQKQAKALRLPVYTLNTFATMAKESKNQNMEATKKSETSKLVHEETTKKSMLSNSDTTVHRKNNGKRKITDDAPSSQSSKKLRDSKTAGVKEGTKDAATKESDADDKHAKKRAKRLEWKQRQREAKLKRLQVKSKK
ncbi:25S rRNA (cytosine2278-C5)-methyltransferase [Fistulifera solaris]|uniref:25S rRNA (Cytosine2278-C5)-methyltransferase n=1 Tax=Fistulifera solaris TaxID=1519565 RepID=A0A1Z5K8E2_FISSO|nr:25S rRNA (cytosine2278-C5)-methyltransferase [Fistulifera solaris]|eukprot:GAX22228.1 25S rRNA (cytosine2278-C5)-methyltransferase [Fistulifera solaris]